MVFIYKFCKTEIFVAIFGNKYGSFSPKINFGGKNGQNPFSAIKTKKKAINPQGHGPFAKRKDPGGGSPPPPPIISAQLNSEQK